MVGLESSPLPRTKSSAPTARLWISVEGEVGQRRGGLPGDISRSVGCERALRTSDGIKHSLAAEPEGSFLTRGQRDGAQGDLCPKQRSVTSLKGATLGDRGIHPKGLPRELTAS